MTLDLVPQGYRFQAGGDDLGIQGLHKFDGADANNIRHTGLDLPLHTVGNSETTLAVGSGSSGGASSRRGRSRYLHACSHKAEAPVRRAKRGGSRDKACDLGSRNQQYRAKELVMRQQTDPGDKENPRWVLSADAP